MAKNTERNISTEADKGHKEGTGAIKYKDCSIPAQLFYEVLNTKNYSLLGTGTIEQLKSAFEDIFEEYLLLDNNTRYDSWVGRISKLSIYEAIKQQANNLIYILAYMPMTPEEKESTIDAINDIPLLNAKIDKEKDLLDECIRVKQSCLGIIENRINMLGFEEEETKEETKYIFQSELAKISVTLGFQIASNITLYEFITYKHTAIDIAKKREKNGK